MALVVFVLAAAGSSRVRRGAVDAFEAFSDRLSRYCPFHREVRKLEQEYFEHLDATAAERGVQLERQRARFDHFKGGLDPLPRRRLYARKSKLWLKGLGFVALVWFVLLFLKLSEHTEMDAVQ